MAYVPCQFSGEGTKLEINLRGTMVSAEVTGLPFYNRKS
jgi:glycine cleavage system aminomethyltransferase T